jgi:hypothetical protein
MPFLPTSRLIFACACALAVLLVPVSGAMAENAPPEPAAATPAAPPVAGTTNGTSSTIGSTSARGPVDQFGRPCTSTTQPGCVKKQPVSGAPRVLLFLGIGAFLLVFVGLIVLGKRQQRADPASTARADAVSSAVQQRLAAMQEAGQLGAVAALANRAPRSRRGQKFERDPDVLGGGHRGGGLEVNGARLLGGGSIVDELKPVVAAVREVAAAAAPAAVDAAQAWDGSTETASEVVAGMVGGDHALTHELTIGSPGMLVVQLGGAVFDGRSGAEPLVHVAVATGGAWISNTYQSRSAPLVLPVAPGVHHLRFAIADVDAAALEVRMAIRVANAA